MRKPTYFRRAALAAAGAALVAAVPALAQESLTEAQVRAKLEAQGYTNVHDVEFEDGVWTADAHSADGKRVDVSIDPRTGKIYPDRQVAQLSREDIKARLAAAGYTKVHDVEMDDGVWKAEARDPQGKAVEVRLDPSTGEVIGSGRD